MDPLEQQLRKWLEAHGYPFELRVGSILRRFGWEAEFGTFYTDLATRQPRPIDLAAKVQAGQKEPRSIVTVRLAIECKASSDKPWVVFAAEPQGLGQLLSELHGAFAPGWLGKSALIETDRELLASTALFGQPSRLGHGVVKAFSDNKTGDPTSPYAAVRSAASAAAGLQAAEARLSSQMGERFPSVPLTVPLVFLDGDLFECYLGPGMNHVVQPVSEALVVTSSPVSGDSVLFVRIVTANALDKFAERAASDALAVARSLLPRARSLIAAFTRTPP